MAQNGIVDEALKTWRVPYAQLTNFLTGGLAFGFEPSKVWGFTKIPRRELVVAGEGFEPSKAEPGDLQSPPSI